uniref:Initiation-specific protein alpha-1,6-mannosyltransferase n=1 Tax=Piromyces sp. TaxID=45796 RepID=A0A2S1TZ19_PIRSP|nr:initiation-specific protein alpha-1,6-mannosyltransferase [Piromyces sp.]
MSAVRFKPKSIAVMAVVLFIMAFPLIAVFKPEKSKIRNSASDYAMSALKEEPIGSTRIPRLIHQTVKDKHNIPPDVQENINSWSEMNPGWKHILYDDDDIMEFMEKYHPNAVEVFKNLDSIVEKTDMWRYAVLDTFGGVYADTDTKCIQPIEQWWGDNKDAKVIIGIEDIRTPFKLRQTQFAELIQFCQWAMASVPGHPIVHYMPYYIYRHMRYEHLGVDRYANPKLNILHRTGPGIWTEAIFDYIIREGYNPRDVFHNGGVIDDILFLPKDGFSWTEPLPDDLKDLPERVKLLHLFYGSWK